MIADSAGTDHGKRFALAVAVVAWISLVTQVTVAFGNPQLLGGTQVMVFWRLLGFFTILTNLLIAVAMMARAFGRWPRAWPEERHALGILAVSIALVSVVYHLLLAKLWNPVGLLWWSDQGLHTVVPVLFMLYWLIFAPKSGFRWSDAGRWMLYPSLYAIYVLARGAVDGWYPYPFIDVGQLGYPAVLANLVGLAAVVCLGALTLIAYARWREPPVA